ncbi:MAG: hypothetical protein QM656_15130 [Paracoccaceae bacterium]
MRDALRAHGGLLIAGFATFVAMGIGQSLLGPALPVFSRSFGLTLAQASWAVTALWVGCAIGVATSFFAPVHVTPRRSLAVMAAGAALIAVAPGWGVTQAGVLVFGAGYGGVTTVFNPRVLHTFGPSMLSLLNAVFSLGAIAAPLIFLALGSQPGLAYGVVAVIAVAIILFARDTGGAPVEPGTTGPFRLHPAILCFQVIGIGCEASLIGIGPAALVRAGETETHAAELLSLFFVAFLVSRLLLTVAMHRLPSFACYLLAMGLAAAFATGACLFPPGPFFALMGFSAGAFFPSGFVTAVRKMGRDPRVTPTIVAAGLVGGILGPLVLSVVAQGMGPRGFFQIIAGIATLTALVAALLLRRMNR